MKLGTGIIVYTVGFDIADQSNEKDMLSPTASEPKADNYKLAERRRRSQRGLQGHRPGHRAATTVGVAPPVRFGGEHKTLAAGERPDRRALLLFGDPNELDDQRRLGRIGPADPGEKRLGRSVVPGGAGSCRGSRRTPPGSTSVPWSLLHPRD